MMLSSTAFTGVILLALQIFLTQAFALPGAPPKPAGRKVRSPHEAKATPNFAPLPGHHRPRAAFNFSNSSTFSIVSTTSSPASTPTVAFGVTTTVISGTTFSLTYVSTTAAQATTIIESDSQTTITQVYASGAPIWALPILPPGFPSPPPPPPPIPPPVGGGGGGGGGSGCVFGCDDDGDDPTNTPNSQSATTASSTPDPSSSSFSSSSGSSSASGLTCSFGCSACVLDRREASPTGTPEIPKREIGNIFQYSSWLKERNIPELEDGIASLYHTVRIAANTLTVDLASSRGIGAVGVSSSQFVAFDNSEHNIYVSGLEGCTSVIVVSRLGAFASHHWETPSFSFTGPNDQFQADVINYLTTALQPLGAPGSTFGDSATTHIYIMTPTIQANNLNSRGDSSNGDFPQEYSDRITDITSTLNGILPNVPIETFVYQRQLNNALFKNNEYGKAMILYSNDQTVDPVTFEDWDPPGSRSVWQTYMQSKIMGSDNWTVCTDPVNEKRDGSSCPISISSPIPSSVSPATSIPISSPIFSSSLVPTPSPITSSPLSSISLPHPSSSLSFASVLTFPLISTSLPQPPTTTSLSFVSVLTFPLIPPTTTPTPSFDPTSEVCIDCTNSLGASSCSASDDACLVDQCESDTNCQACGIDCSTFG